MKKFVYVFSEKDRDMLLERGIKLVQSDEEKKFYIFVNEPAVNFALGNTSFVLSDTLTL